jgi:hypothetical protein
MRNYRALLLAIAALIVLVIVLFIALLNRHSTTTIVVSSGGLIGGSAKAGDTLMFTTYQPGDPGYAVHFTGVSPCANNGGDLKVTSGHPASCTLVSSAGTKVSYIYQIKRNLSQNVVHHPDTVVPCKLCYFNNGSVVGNGTEQPQHAASAASDNTTVQIGCTVDNGAPGVSPPEADVTNDGVATVGWFQIDSAWTATFDKNSNPCTTNDFSTNGSTQCTIDPKAQPKSYTYNWTLTCNGKSAPGTGTVMVYAPQSAPQ